MDGLNALATDKPQEDCKNPTAAETPKSERMESKAENNIKDVDLQMDD